MTALAAPKSSTLPRLPWSAILAAVLAFLALYIREGHIPASLFEFGVRRARGAAPGDFDLDPRLPLLALALAFSRGVDFRLESLTMQKWARLVLFGLVIVLALKGAPTLDEGMLFNAHYTDIGGELCAAEIVVRAWSKNPLGLRYQAGTVLLSGLIFLTACNTAADTYLAYMTPLFILFEILSIQSFRPQNASGSPARPFQVGRILAVCLALFLGGSLYLEAYRHRNDLQELGMRLLREMPVPQTVGISTSPHLGSTYGLEGTLDRALRIETNADVTHLRALSFETYRKGEWAPIRNQRRFVPCSLEELRPNAPGALALVTRLTDNSGIIFAPLNATGLDPRGSGEWTWARAEGGPLFIDRPAPTLYVLHVGADDAQGPLCDPPDAKERDRLLAVPPEIDPRVHVLAQQIVAGLSTPLQKARAIENYLPAHHGYSLSVKIGPGDPVSNFLLQKKDAHCEYFGSAAAILLRCVGVPARYVVGYYAHETEDGALIVRQRDAHAWTECWIDGQGWITIDATPGGGRPDKLAGPIPAWTRFKEWVQDKLAALRRHLTLPNVLFLLGFLLAAVVIANILQLRWKTRPPKPKKQRAFAYATPQEDLIALFARFEALCRRKGLNCPPTQTWQEYLVRAPLTRPPDANAFPFAQAQAFVSLYNAARFGRPEDREAIDELQARLSRLEKNSVPDQGKESA